MSVKMAIRPSKAFGSTRETWLGMQVAYDLSQARGHTGGITVEHFVAAGPPYGRDSGVRVRRSKAARS